MRLLVGCVSVFIGFAALSHLYVNLWVWQDDEHPMNAWALFKLVLFLVLVANLVTNYVLAITSDPGSPPSAWTPPDWTPEELASAQRAALGSSPSAASVRVANDMNSFSAALSAPLSNPLSDVPSPPSQLDSASSSSSSSSSSLVRSTTSATSSETSKRVSFAATPDGRASSPLSSSSSSPSIASPQRNWQSRFGPSYCRLCESFRPDRAHHCRVCGKCVLKMDHHCPWINNCVGYHNQKNFYLFLFYCSVAITLVVVSYLATGMHLLRSRALFDDSFHVDSPPPSSSSSLPEHKFANPGVIGALMVLNLSLLVPVVLGIAHLWIFQTQLIMQNITSIESSMKRRYLRHQRERGVRRPRWPYDHGRWLVNVTEVLGPHWSSWLAPWFDPPSDGFSFALYTITNDEKLSV